MVIEIHPGMTANQTCGSRCNATYQLAAYLIAAGHNTYYGYGESWEGLWPWLPVYDKPLGPPKAKALRQGDVFTREFEHLNVTLDVGATTAWLQWDS